MPKRKTRDEPDEDLDIGDAPTEINPYKILVVAPDATSDQIRTAYRKAALKHHPDKVAPEAKEAAHQKFQEIALAYAVLSDPRRRNRYDTTGRTEESLDLDDDDTFDWTSYFRAQFHEVVTEEAISTFASGYKGSDEERDHVLKFYTKHRGHMGKLYEEVMLSDMTVDETRFRAIIDAAISEGEVEAFARYTEETETARSRRIDRARKRKEQEAREAEEAERAKERGGEADGDAGGEADGEADGGADRDTDGEADGGAAKGERGKTKQRSRGAGKTKGTQKAAGGGGMDDLAAMIQQRQKSREGDFFASLEAKYAPAGKKGKKKMEEPPEEAFARNAKGNGTGKRAKR